MWARPGGLHEDGDQASEVNELVGKPNKWMVR